MPVKGLTDLTWLDFFESRIKKTEYCWNWNGSKTVLGYGILRINKKRVYAHRQSYSHYKGEIETGHVVMHSCDNPSCVNPEHLFCGTQLDNIKDMHFKNRHAKGQMIPNSIFDEDKIKLIRSLYIPWKFGCKKVADLVGSDRKHIWQIISGKIWKEVQA